MPDLEEVHRSWTDRTHNKYPSPDQVVHGDDLETNWDTYDDLFLSLSLNENGLKHEKWKAKNNRLQEFLNKIILTLWGSRRQILIEMV